MSKIIEKPFDALKKIYRSVFLGSPNLITSSDLNRQFEAIKYQMDSLDRNTGARALDGFSISASTDRGVNKVQSVSWTSGTILSNGALFAVEAGSSSMVLELDQYIYVHLVADKRLVTYEDDFSHEIAGAKFEDGTSQPAANQWVYVNERIVLSSEFDLQDSLNVLMKIGVISIEDKESIYFDKMYLDSDNSCLSDKEFVPVDIDFPTNDMREGKWTYNTLLNKLTLFVNKISSWMDNRDLYGAYHLTTYEYNEGNQSQITVKFNDLPDIQAGDLVRLNMKVTVKLSGSSTGQATALLSGIIVVDRPSTVSNGGYIPLVASRGGTQDSAEFTFCNCNFKASDKSFYLSLYEGNTWLLVDRDFAYCEFIRKVV